MFPYVKTTHTSQLSLQSHIWPYFMWTWLLSKPYTRVHSNLYRNFCVGTNWSHVDLLVSFTFFQADNNFPSGLCPAVLLNCLSLCLCEDNLINTHYAVGLLISTKPCVSDLFLLELFARVSTSTFAISSVFCVVFFFWSGSISFAKNCRNIDFSEFYVCRILGIWEPCFQPNANMLIQTTFKFWYSP